MSKGLEALKEYRKHQQGVNVYADELLDIVEKELKAWEIIKEMRDYKDDIAIAEIITEVEESEDFEKFSSRYRNFFSKEEYEILKEALK